MPAAANDLHPAQGGSRVTQLQLSAVRGPSAAALHLLIDLHGETGGHIHNDVLTGFAGGRGSVRGEGDLARAGIAFHHAGAGGAEAR